MGTPPRASLAFTDALAGWLVVLFLAASLAFVARLVLGLFPRD